jgi:TetR/AcrR family transcriptional repressor of nem operon
MVKVSQHQAAANREALVAAAGRLLRRKGVDAVGVAELCEAAGLTHGALYSRFGSKNELIAEAFQQGQRASQARLSTAMEGKSADLAAFLDCYISRRQRDNGEECCPMLASASEASRQDHSFRQNFAAAFGELTALIEGTSRDAGNPDCDTAMVIAASMIGVMAVARALKAPDAVRSDRLLQAARTSLADMARAPARGRPKQKQASSK